MESIVQPQNGYKLINLMECSSCHCTLAAPIYSCQNGHIICSSCRGNQHICSACSGPVEKRNKPAEHIAEQLPHSCVNKDRGCKVTYLQKDRDAHESVCPYRLYQCIPCQPRCRWRGRRFQILEHMKDEHKELVWIKSYNCLVYENFDFESDYNCTNVLSCFREIFWCHSRRDSKQKKLFEVVQYNGREENAAKYEYEFEFYSKGNKRRAVFKNTVKSENENIEKIYESGDCIMLDLQVLQHFVTEDNKLYYNFKLSKISRT